MNRHRVDVFKSLNLVHHLLFARGFHPLNFQARRFLAKGILKKIRTSRGLHQ